MAIPLGLAALAFPEAIRIKRPFALMAVAEEELAAIKARFGTKTRPKRTQPFRSLSFVQGAWPASLCGIYRHH